jgi:hypothetical protein
MDRAKVRYCLAPLLLASCTSDRPDSFAEKLPTPEIVARIEGLLATAPCPRRLLTRQRIYQYDIKNRRFIHFDVFEPEKGAPAGINVVAHTVYLDYREVAAGYYDILSESLTIEYCYDDEKNSSINM